MTNQNITLNNTVEEELRIMLCEERKIIAGLQTQVKFLEQNVRDLENQKYQAYARLAELTKLDKVQTSI